jgi:hypothetical protein
MKKLCTTFLMVLIGFTTYAQNVTIPDANFKAYLLGNTSINTDTDGSVGEISVAEATVFNGGIVCGSLAITDLTGVEAFTALTGLYCVNNSLTSLDVSSNIALTSLIITSNSIGSIDVSNNTALTFLFCTANNLSVIDVSNNLALNYFRCAINSITTLDVSNNSALISLQCDRNSLTSLDVSTNTALVDLLCFSNDLSSLDVSNGNNTNMSAFGFDASSNPNLTCIKVDNAAYSTTNWTSIDVQTSFSETVCCVINVPDANFKAYLVGNAAINTDADSEISCAEATAFTGTIICNNLNITDLTGIEAFTALAGLSCTGNSLTSLDVSNNTALTDLYCYSNSLISLDVSTNTNLTDLRCHSNNLTSLDVSSNTALVFFYCSDNNLTSLDVSTNTNLTDLMCHTNSLTSLDVSNNTVLAVLVCHLNSLNSLDLSANLNLDRLYCFSNSLTSLNVANGNNSNIGGADFIASNNPNLTCIIVDDVTYSNANWANVDAQTSFSVTPCCSPTSSSFIMSACNSYTVPSGDETYTSSQTVNDTLANACGADSVMTINLTINNPTMGTDLQTACGSYSWIDGNNYTLSNNTSTFNIIGGAASGCDSLVTLDLTINNFVTSTDIQTACGNYVWIDGSNYTLSNNVSTFNVVGGAANGCDSLVTLDLTINNFVTSTDVQSACGNYVWIDGSNYTLSNNVSTFNVVGGAANGCDSLVSLDLTITPLPDNTTTTTGFTISANQTGATYQWIDCNNGNSFIAGETNVSYTAITNGDYAVIITNNGCSDTSACVNVSTVGIDQNAIVNQVSMFPNPTKGSVVFQLGNLKDVSISVFSLTGELVYQKNNINTTSHQLALNNASGFYIVNVVANGESQQFKLIKE